MEKAYLQALKDEATRTEAKEKAWQIGVEKHKAESLGTLVAIVGGFLCASDCSFIKKGEI